MTKKLGNLFYFKRGGEPTGCGFLAARELDPWIENRLSELDVPTEYRVEVPDIHYDFSWFLRSVRKASAAAACPCAR